MSDRDRKNITAATGSTGQSLSKSIRGSERMGTDPIGRLLIRMAWPAILSMTINALYNVVDSMYVARLSKVALTAVSFVNPVQMLMIAFGVGSAVGVNSLIARRLGAQRYEEADKAASTSLRIAVFNYAIFLMIGLFAAVPFMSYYTEDPLTYGYGLAYMRICLCFSVFSMIEIQLEKVLQATGNMVAPMICSLSGAVTNIILDPLLIFGMGPFPRLEVKGAAIATVIGQIVSLCISTYIVARKDHAVKIRVFGFHLDWQVVRDIYAVGAPGIVMQAIGSVMLLGYNAILAAEATAVAVLGIYFKLQSFIFMPVFGLNQGAMPLMGFNFGAENRRRLMQTYKVGLLIALLIMSAGTLLFQTVPGLFLRIFDADSEMLRIGVPALRIISLCFIPAAFGIMTGTVFQATGHGLYSMYGSLLRQLIGILPAAYMLYHAFGVEVSWFSFPLAEVIGLIYSAVMLRHLYKKEISRLGE